MAGGYDRPQRWGIGLHMGLVAIALFTCHAISSLVFSVMGLVPSSPTWGLTLTLGGFLAVAGTAMGLQSLMILPKKITSLVSGAASGGLLLFYSFGQLSDQQVQWAITGAVIGLLLGGGFGVWTVAQRHVYGQVAIALASSLCAYGTAFGLGTWALAAISAQQLSLSLGLTLLTGIYLWLTRQSIDWIYRQWRRT